MFARETYRVVAETDRLEVTRGYFLPVEKVYEAIDKTHGLIDQIVAFDIDLFSLLGMRNLSAFIGELLAASLIKACGDDFVKNPHQDGYPDLLLMDETGKKLLNSLAGRMRDKAPFSPFATGGIEVKATCGSVPTPKELAKRGMEKPGLGDQRVTLLKGYDWKAHHRDTNNLLSLFWDFVDGAPRVIAIFYCSDLSPEDWGGIVQPKPGGGRTTSVSIMTRAGVRKMFRHCVLIWDDKRYIDFFQRYNGTVLFAD